MASKKTNADELRALCARILPDDGTNPRDDKKRTADRPVKDDRKIQQLCKQVAQMLQLVLPDLSGLSDVRIAQVAPAPNAGRLCVTVAVPEAANRQQVAWRLDQCSGYLRRELAHALSRRRVPTLVFALISEETINRSEETTNE